jgi:formylglycine-generating enzyme required for sulfatase activity
MGDHFNEGWIDELPVHAVYIDVLYMDRYEVSNERYAAGLNWALSQGLITVTGGTVYKAGTAVPYCDTATATSWSRITWNGSTFGVVTGKEKHPMVMVTWYGAAACANWRSGMEAREPSYNTSTWECNFAADGYRLPTDAEWERAARGGDCHGGEHDPYCRYPWGDTVDGSKANYLESGDAYEQVGSQPWTTPVGYYNGNQTPPGIDMPNGYGLYDMGGNVDEWCNDWYALYSPCDPPPCDNPHGPSATGDRVIRGGDWNNIAPSCRCSVRDGNSPAVQLSYFGFRLALDGVDYDGDSDGIPDYADNCPTLANPTQEDSDGDGVGDACDNCPLVPNSSQSDLDNDGIGDACDPCILVNDVCIPTLSEWGMVAMAALMLAAGAVVVSRRRAVG